MKAYSECIIVSIGTKKQVKCCKHGDNDYTVYLLPHEDEIARGENALDALKSAANLLGVHDFEVDLSGTRHKFLNLPRPACEIEVEIVNSRSISIDDYVVGPCNALSLKKNTLYKTTGVTQRTITFQDVETGEVKASIIPGKDGIYPQVWKVINQVCNLSGWTKIDDLCYVSNFTKGEKKEVTVLFLRVDLQLGDIHAQPIKVWSGLLRQYAAAPDTAHKAYEYAIQNPAATETEEIRFHYPEEVEKYFEMPAGCLANLGIGQEETFYLYRALKSIFLAHADRFGRDWISDGELDEIFDEASPRSGFKIADLKSSELKNCSVEKVEDRWSIDMATLITWFKKEDKHQAPVFKQFVSDLYSNVYSSDIPSNITPLENIYDAMAGAGYSVGLIEAALDRLEKGRDAITFDSRSGKFTIDLYALARIIWNPDLAGPDIQSSETEPSFISTAIANVSIAGIEPASRSDLKFLRVRIRSPGKMLWEPLVRKGSSYAISTSDDKKAARFRTLDIGELHLAEKEGIVGIAFVRGVPRKSAKSRKGMIENSDWKTQAIVCERRVLSLPENYSDEILVEKFLAKYKSTVLKFLQREYDEKIEDIRIVQKGSDFIVEFKSNKTGGDYYDDSMLADFILALHEKNIAAIDAAILSNANSLSIKDRTEVLFSTIKTALLARIATVKGSDEMEIACNDFVTAFGSALQLFSKTKYPILGHLIIVFMDLIEGKWPDLVENPSKSYSIAITEKLEAFSKVVPNNLALVFRDLLLDFLKEGTLYIKDLQPYLEAELKGALSLKEVPTLESLAERLVSLGVQKTYTLAKRFLQHQLKTGTAIERERVNDRKLARELALQNLGKHWDYYIKLEQGPTDVEKLAGQEKTPGLANISVKTKPVARKENPYDFSTKQLNDLGISNISSRNPEAQNLCLQYLEFKFGKREMNEELCNKILDTQKQGERFSDTLKKIAVREKKKHPELANLSSSEKPTSEILDRLIDWFLVHSSDIGEAAAQEAGGELETVDEQIEFLEVLIERVCDKLKLSDLKALASNVFTDLQKDMTISKVAMNAIVEFNARKKITKAETKKFMTRMIELLYPRKKGSPRLANVAIKWEKGEVKGFVWSSEDGQVAIYDPESLLDYIESDNEDDSLRQLVEGDEAAVEAGLMQKLSPKPAKIAQYIRNKDAFLETLRDFDNEYPPYRKGEFLEIGEELVDLYENNMDAFEAWGVLADYSQIFSYEDREDEDVLEDHLKTLATKIGDCLEDHLNILAKKLGDPEESGKSKQKKKLEHLTNISMPAITPSGAKSKSDRIKFIIEQIPKSESMDEQEDLESDLSSELGEDFLGDESVQTLLYDPEGETLRKKLAKKYKIPLNIFDAIDQSNDDVLADLMQYAKERIDDYLNILGPDHEHSITGTIGDALELYNLVDKEWNEGKLNPEDLDALINFVRYELDYALKYGMEDPELEKLSKSIDSYGHRNKFANITSLEEPSVIDDDTFASIMNHEKDRLERMTDDDFLKIIDYIKGRTLGKYYKRFTVMYSTREDVIQLYNRVRKQFSEGNLKQEDLNAILEFVKWEIDYAFDSGLKNAKIARLRKRLELQKLKKLRHQLRKLQLRKLRTFRAKLANISISDQGKAKITGIEFGFSENDYIEKGKKFDTFHAANDYLAVAQDYAPKDRAYHKIDFIIYWSDGETWKGRYDLQNYNIQGYPDLGKHVKEFLMFYSGQWKPAHISEKNYEILKADMKHAKEYKEFLETHEFEDDLTNSQPLSDASSSR